MFCIFVKIIITGRNEVVAKVIFLHVFVILFTGGSTSVHAGMPHPQDQTPQSRHPPGPDTHPPPPRKRQISPEKADPPAPKMSRPTAKGEIEGDQIQAHSQGGN